MRALHVSTNRDLGGGERQLLALVLGSREHGIDARVCVREQGQLKKLCLHSGIDTSSLRARIAYDPFAMRYLTNLARRDEIDIMHLHDGGAASLGVAAGAWSKTPVIVHRRIASALRNSWFTKLKYDPKRVALFIAVSNIVADVLKNAGIPTNQIVVIPSGVDIQKLDAIAQREKVNNKSDRLQIGKLQIGTIAKLAPKKGVDIVLRAFAKIHERVPNTILTIVGSGPDEESNRALAAELNINDFVNFAGSREGAPILATWDLFLFASELEGSPGVVREAMALRVPIVAVDAPGTVEVLGDCGIVTSRGDALSLANAAIRLLNNQNERADLAARARARVEHYYSIDSMVENTIAAARGVLDR
ncbi:MAG: glycosyltransferase [Planctomycetota bacterium]